MHFSRKLKIFIFLFLIMIYNLNYISPVLEKVTYTDINSNYIKNENLYSEEIDSKDFVFNAHFGILTQKIPYIVNDNPEISVIIPMMNAENYINKAILSIQNQNFSHFEIIIVNDYSSDNSLKIVQKLSYYDKRIKLITII